MKTPLSYRSVAVVTILLMGGLAQGGTNTVTSLADNGPGSLRFMVLQSLPGDFIVFATNGTVGLTNGEILVAKNLSIIGNGPTNLAISASSRSRIFSITSGVSVVIANLTLRDGRTPNGTNGTNSLVNGGNGGNGESSNPGGAILNAGVLGLTNCNLFSNGTGAGGNGGRSGINGSGGYGGYSGNGGAIYNVGRLTLHLCLLTGNATGPSGNGGASGSITGPAGFFTGQGGAVYNGGTSVVVRCTVSTNFTGSGGFGGQGGPGGNGGGFYNAGTFWMIDSTLSANVAGSGGTASEIYSGGRGGSGGGLYNAGDCAVTNCTFDGNRCGTGGVAASPNPGPGSGGDGGGVFASGTFRSYNSTFCRNVTGQGGTLGQIPPPFGTQLPPGRGGGINSEGATLFNTLVASNSSVSNFSYYANTDVYGTFTSSGNNLVSVTNGSTGFTNGTDLCGSLANPLAAKIGSLAANGGPTMTCALLAGSAAIDAGGNTPTGTDQRGFPRQSGLAVDIGAFEVQTPSGPPRMTGLFASNGQFKFAFTNKPGALFTVFSSTNVALPATNWTLLGQATENTTGQFQFSDTTTNNRHQLYRLRSP